MGRLKEIAVNFAPLCKYDYEYELDSGLTIKLSLDKSNLPHLVGLHKLVDIDILRKFNEKKVYADEIYRKMKNGVLTDYEVFNSVHFNTIENRFSHIDNLESLLFDRIILDFDKSKLSTKIKSNILLYREIDGQYVHIALVPCRDGSYAPETLLVHENDYYIKNQTELIVNKLIIKHRGRTFKEIIYNHVDEEVAAEGI